MAENPDLNKTDKRPHGAPSPRKSSDILAHRLAPVRQRAEQAEHQRDEAVARNREFKEQVNGLHEAPRQEVGEAATADRGETTALRQELELVRTQSAADLEALRQQLSKNTRANAATRNVVLEAERQAVRQEAAILRQVVKEKDKVLEELAAQCRSLEDALEDRDREMDRLHQSLEQSRGEAVFSGDSRTGVLGVDSMGIVGRDTDPLYVFPEEGNSAILDGVNLVSPPSCGRSRRTVWLAATAGLLTGVLAVTAALLILVWVGRSPSDIAVAPESWKQQPSYEVPAVPGVGLQPGAIAAAGRNTAESALESMSAEF